MKVTPGKQVSVAFRKGIDSRARMSELEYWVYRLLVMWLCPSPLFSLDLERDFFIPNMGIIIIIIVLTFLF